MQLLRTALALAALSAAAAVSAQQTSLMQLKTDASNRSIAVTADDRISVDANVAVLHIGFTTQPKDSKSCYADGAKTSNNIIGAIKAAGIPEADIHSEGQRISAFDAKQHKFQLSEEWTVRTPPERAAEILDIAVNNGATDSGEIDWTVKDPKALEDQVLKSASLRATTRAQAIADGLGVKLGKAIYATNQVSGGNVYRSSEMMMARSAQTDMAVSAPPLAIEPHKVERDATVYVVFAIE